MTKALPVTRNIIYYFSLFEHNKVYLLTLSSTTSFHLLAKAFTGLQQAFVESIDFVCA